MGTHALAPVDLAQVQVAGAGRGGIRTHLLERPDEVDCGRTRLGEDAVGGVEVLPTLRRQGVSIRSGDADRGCTANGQRADRVGHLRGGLAAELDLLVREPALIQQDHSARLQTKNAFRG